MGSEMGQITLADALEFVVDNRGKTVPVSEKGIALIATNCISNKNLYPEYINVRYVSEDIYNNWFRAHPQPNDILLTNKGSQNGAICLVPDPVDFCIAQDMVALRADKTKIDPSYLFAALRSPYIQAQIKQLNVDSVIPHFKKTDFDKLFISLPTEEMQRSIGKLYLNFSDKIELNRQMNATLEGMAQALFKSWFVDFDPVIDNALSAGNPIPEAFAACAETRRKALADGTVNRDGAKQFPAAFQFTEEMGWVPEGWKAQRLYDIANFINGAAYKGSDFTDDPDDLPVIKIAEIKNGISGQTKFTHTIKDEKYRISDGEILLSWSGNPDTSIDTFVWTDGEGWLNQHIFKVSLKDEAERSFVYYQLKFLRSVFAEIARDKQTTGLGHFTGADMKRLMVFKPKTEILTEFNKTAASLCQRYYQNRIAEKTLSNLRDTLLPKLISGEIRIPEAEKITEEALA